MSYFSNISDSIRTTLRGMGLSILYFFEARKGRNQESVSEDNYFKAAEGIFTVQYPKESIPIPDNGRYKLHNEIEDCIVCDKCAKICPVDCIDIEPVRSPEIFGETSDGTPLRIHAAKFDIDMAKCCFCGLCTVVCPTECLTMTKEHDFSTTDILDHNFSFSKMTENEISEKKKAFDEYQTQKAQAKPELPEVKQGEHPSEKVVAKPVFKPKIAGAKPAMKPKVPGSKPVIKPKIDSSKASDSSKKMPVKPVIKSNQGGSVDEEMGDKKPMKPKISKKK